MVPTEGVERVERGDEDKSKEDSRFEEDIDEDGKDDEEEEEEEEEEKKEEDKNSSSMPKGRGFCVLSVS